MPRRERQLNFAAVKRFLVEGWALLAVAVIAFLAGLLIGDLGSSPEKKTVYVAASETEAAVAETSPEPAPEATGGSSGEQLFAGIGCGGCHTLAAANSTGTTGPDLNESLATDDNTAGIEEMIIHPNSEVVEGYPPNVMPQTYGESLSGEEVHELAAFLVESTKAKP